MMGGRTWRRLGLRSRLALTCGAVLAALSCVLAYNFLRTEADLRSREFAIELDSRLVTLATALTGPAILGDYTGVAELLATFARDIDVERIEWAPVRGRPVEVHGPEVAHDAPAWFEAAIGLPAYSGSRRIVVGGSDYGVVSLQLDPRPEINAIWAHIAVSATTALVGIAAVLLVMLLTVERGLRPLTRLVSGMRRFEGGDFSVRVVPGGAPELASSIVAFNRMAERVGAVFDSLRESEARNRHLAMIVEQSNESILTRDLDGRITSWNKGAERLFGWTEAEAIGKRTPELHGKGIVDSAYELDLARIDQPDTWAREASRITKSGLFRDVSVTRAPLLDEGGGVIGEIRIARDITELKKAQAQLLAAKEGLEARVVERTAELALARDESEAANRAKSSFLAAMSHEIRTPMNGVVGMIEVLEQSRLEPSQADMVKTIRESADALLGIVDDVLDFSKIEAGQFQVEAAPMDASAVVEGVCDALDRLAGQKGVELALFTDPALPARVLGDSTRLRQVLLNLIGNAIKFSSAPGRRGRVSIGARPLRRGAQALLEFVVSDNGIGMDEDTLSRLFAPFCQADVSTTRRYGGTGLGLSISHRLVALMGGEMEVTSTLGQGSTFIVRLPAPPAAAPAESGPAIDLTGLRCLVAAASLPDADSMALYLAHAGASVHRVADPPAAAAWLRDCPPGRCIVVDSGSADTLDAVRGEMRAVCSARSDLDARFVELDCGASRAPAFESPDVVVLRGGLRRGALVKAVARAAGRIADAPQTLSVVKQPASPSTGPAGAARPLILVAEDNEINQKVLAHQLKLLGHEAHIAGDGQEALALLRQRPYGLLITDLHMPVMDGYQLAVAVRTAEAGQRRMGIVALTANAMKGEADRCRAIGIDDYMTKPLQIAALGAMVRKWLPAPGADDAPTHAGSGPAAGPPPPVDLDALEAC